MVTDLANRLFRGDITEMVCHLLDSNEITAEELAEGGRKPPMGIVNKLESYLLTGFDLE